MKALTVLFTLLFLPLGICATNCIPDCETATDWTLEVRGAYYYVPNKSLKRVYTDNWIDYEVEAAKRIHPFIEIWGGVNWATKHGHTKRDYYGITFKDSTRIFVLPVSLGLKVIYPLFPYVDVYAGAGVCYSFLKIKNFCKEHYSYLGFSDSPFKKAIYKNEFGGVFKVGFQVAMSDSTFLDFFVDYYAQRFHLSHKTDPRDVFKRHVDCSGFKFGAGFGVYF